MNLASNRNYNHGVIIRIYMGINKVLLLLNDQRGLSLSSRDGSALDEMGIWRDNVKPATRIKRSYSS